MNASVAPLRSLGMEKVERGGMAATVTVLSVFGLGKVGENLELLAWKGMEEKNDDVYAILLFFFSLSGRRGEGGYAGYWRVVLGNVCDIIFVILWIR